MKYNFNVPLGSGVCPYAPQPKPILGSLIGGAISGLFGLAGQSQQAGYTKEQQKLQSKLNREEMAYSQGLQNNQQNWLMNTQYGKMVSGMKNAGLNPATANGTSPGSVSAGHPSTGGVGPAGPPTSSLGSDIVSSFLNVKNVEKDLEIKDKQKGLLDAQTRDANATAEGKEKENKTFEERWEALKNEILARAEKQFGEGELAQQKAKESQQLITNLQTENDKLKEEIENLKSNRKLTDAQTLFTNKQANQYDGYIRSVIFKNTAEGNLANGRNGREGQMLLFDMVNSAALSDMYDSSTDLNRINTKLAGIQKQWNEFLMNQDMKWNERNQWIDAGCKIIGTAANAIGQFAPTKIATSSFGYTPLGNFESFTSQTRRRF